MGQTPGFAYEVGSKAHIIHAPTLTGHLGGTVLRDVPPTDLEVGVATRYCLN